MTADSSAETASDEVGGTRRVRLDIAYEGTDFSGWGRQPDRRTVQGEIERALAVIFRRFPPSPTLVVAGRTDAGVHATGQVAHTELTEAQLAALLKSRGGPPAADAAAALSRRVNGVLGPSSDIVISRTGLAPDGFDARFSATWRRYVYRIADSGAFRDPLARRHTAWVPVRLDVEAMDAAGRTLLGLRDFEGYCKPNDGATTIRTLLDFRWERNETGVVIAHVTADAFCRNMVRALVGACVAVGSGKLDGSALATMQRGPDRPDAFKTMPARGLTLVEVGYPPDNELAARAEVTRARRTLPPGPS